MIFLHNSNNIYAILDDQTPVVAVATPALPPPPQCPLEHRGVTRQQQVEDSLLLQEDAPSIPIIPTQYRIITTLPTKRENVQ